MPCRGGTGDDLLVPPEARTMNVTPSVLPGPTAAGSMYTSLRKRAPASSGKVQENFANASPLPGDFFQGGCAAITPPELVNDAPSGNSAGPLRCCAEPCAGRVPHVACSSSAVRSATTGWASCSLTSASCWRDGHIVDHGVVRHLANVEPVAGVRPGETRDTSDRHADPATGPHRTRANPGSSRCPSNWSSR